MKCEICGDKTEEIRPQERHYPGVVNEHFGYLRITTTWGVDDVKAFLCDKCFEDIITYTTPSRFPKTEAWERFKKSGGQK